ncbi:MAG: ABC transporter permease [Aliarcobacter sp.]|nr:ABC transporter permease [Aliarcobacter sp.]
MKEFIKGFYKNNFVYNGTEKLSKLTIFFIVLLDILIYSTLNLGIDFQTRVLNSPSVTFPYKCRDVINSSNIDDFNQYFYSKDSYNNYYYDNNYQEIKDSLIDNRCDITNKKVDEVKKEHDIKQLIATKNQLLNTENKINNELYYIKENYNTVLFEKLSSQDTDKSIIKDNLTTQNVKEKYETYEKELAKIQKEKEDFYKIFSDSKSVKDLISYVNDNKLQINDDIEKANRAYSLKIELVTLLFLFPLVFGFFYLMKRYLAKEKYILYVMFKNIFIISLIPTLISIFSLIYEFLPKIFLEKLMQFFYELEIPFIVYYFVIIIFVFIFGFLIIKVQKRYKENNNKLKNNSISKVESYNKNICNNCGNSVDFKTMNFCPCCQNQLKIECNSCHNKTIKGLSYCINCGDNIKE